MLIRTKLFFLYFGYDYAKDTGYTLSIATVPHVVHRQGDLIESRFVFYLHLAKPYFQWYRNRDISSQWTGRDRTLTGWVQPSEMELFYWNKRLIWLKPFGLGTGRINWI